MRVRLDKRGMPNRRMPMRRQGPAWLIVATLTAATALLGTIAPAPAAAVDSETGEPLPASDRPYSHRRYTVGLSAVAGIATSKDLDPSPGVQLRIGARVHRHFAVEGFGEWHNQFDDDFRHYSAWAAGMSLRSYFLTGKIQPFLLVGGGVIQTRKMGGGDTQSDIGFAPRAGVGIDYYLSRDLAVSLDATYVIPVAGVAGLDFIGINWGLQWY